MRLSDLGERALIGELSRLINIGDDAACIPIDDKYLVITVDMAYRPTHFFKQMSWRQMGKHIVTVNLSDIAAMGAEPIAFLLGYGSPDISLEDFWDIIISAKEQCEKYQAELVGGDTIEADELILSGTAVGLTEKPVLRSTANPKEVVGVTGDLGSASLGGWILEKDADFDPNSSAVKKALEPEPRTNEALMLREYVSSMTDISDSLAVSLFNISGMSEVGFEIHVDELPISDDSKDTAVDLETDAIEHALYGGGDYELLFTASEENFERIKRKLDVTSIGAATKEVKITGIKNRSRFEIKRKGYEHFR